MYELMSVRKKQPPHGHLLVHLTSKAKEGLLFVADRTFEMNVSNYPLESLDSGESIENGSPRTEKTNHRHLTDPQPEPSVDSS